MMNHRALALLVATTALSLIGGSALAATITLDVAADTYVRSNQATTNFDGDPDDEVIVGTVGATLNGLIRFDTSALSALAGPGQTIDVTSVTLKGASRSGDAGQGTTDVTLEVRDYGFEFVEGIATWNDPDGDGAAGTGDTVGGGTDAGDIVANATMPITVSTPVTFTSTAAFVGVVEAALSGDDTVNLWIHRTAGGTSGFNSFIRFGDEDRPTESFDLVIDYELVPEPASLALLGVGGLALLRRRRG